MILENMNKFVVFCLIFFSFSGFSQTGTAVDTMDYQEVIEEAYSDESEINLAIDTLKNALIPLNNETVTAKKLPENFKENYSGSEFNYDINKENGFLTRLSEMWRNFLDWFSTDSGGSSIVVDEIINIVLFIGITIGLGFLIYYLNQKGFIRLFAKKETQIINEKFIEENIEQINFDALTTKAKTENNLRKAVRYYYLWMLKNWSQNGFIEYEPNKTTKQYLNEIQNPTNKAAFQYVSYIYDNIWYGYHEIQSNDFQKIEEQFVQLINKQS